MAAAGCDLKGLKGPLARLHPDVLLHRGGTVRTTGAVALKFNPEQRQGAYMVLLPWIECGRPGLGAAASLILLRHTEIIRFRDFVRADGGPGEIEGAIRVGRITHGYGALRLAAVISLRKALSNTRLSMA